MEDAKYYVVTEEQLRDRARSYVPVKEKLQFIDDVCTRCFDTMNIGGATGEDVPPVYKENLYNKNKYLAAAVAKLYLGENFTPEDEDDPWKMSDEVYDYFSAVKPLTQIERIRRTSKDRELQDKCFDLVQDYKDLREMLNSEIHGLMRAMNDTLTRFQMLITQQTTPEYMKGLVSGLNEAQAELNAYVEERKGLFKDETKQS